MFPRWLPKLRSSPSSSGEDAEGGGESMKKNDIVKIIGGNNEIGQPSMIGKIGRVSSIGIEYLVKGKKTKEIYVTFGNSELHCFNDYHLELIIQK